MRRGNKQRTIVMELRDAGNKDSLLRVLAERHNVAQFVSFAPQTPLRQRYSCVKNHPLDFQYATPTTAIAAIRDHSNSGTVNVRTFTPEKPKGGDFTYGVIDVRKAVAIVEKYANRGYHTIVNETIDIHDGGVSGVLLGDAIEFAPGDTPRCVEKPGITALPARDGKRLLSTVYEVVPDLNFESGWRVEFSLHPLRTGFRNTHTVIWESEWIGATTLEPQLRWPNKFSQLIGDKAFGLLIAHLANLPVPNTTVIPRKIAPFQFGADTGLSEKWFRTCPVTPVPGKFTTHRGWVDPAGVLAQRIRQEIASPQFSHNKESMLCTPARLLIRVVAR